MRVVFSLFVLYKLLHKRDARPQRGGKCALHFLFCFLILVVAYPASSSVSLTYELIKNYYYISIFSLCNK